jgi:hypothetical protein
MAMRIRGLDRSRGAAAAGVAAALVLVGALIGWSLGHHHGDDTHTAKGQGAAQQSGVTVKTSGWAYDVPNNITWYGSDGTEHDGSRPPCLPQAGSVGPVTFAWVAYRANGATQRQVVSVDCSH